MQLRDYQYKAEQDINGAWAQHNNVLYTLATGGGKTVIVSSVIKNNPLNTCVIAHRQELVSQMSLALAKSGVYHKIIGPKDVIKWVARLHTEEFGQPYYDPHAPIAVAGVRTLLRRADSPALKAWLPSVKRWVIDEGHHVVRGNEWGKATALFKNAKGLGVTATPLRADGKGLGAHADGVFDILIEGPGMRNLIELGYLCDYRVIAPPTDIDMRGVDISSSTGDYNPEQMRKRVRNSHIVGDVVTHYLKFAAGKQGITFAPDVELAITICNNFSQAGIKAEVVHGGTNGILRTEIIRRFKRKEIQQLINVDIFGEGFDVPGIEVVSFARPTFSYGLYCQQFGRALRILEGKDKAIILDHVGNVALHKLPDRKRIWTLDARDKRTSSERDPDAIPVTTCTNPECWADYEAYHKACPYCGTVPPISDRSKPEFVDGDLYELAPEVLAKMRGEIERINAPESVVVEKLSYAGANRGAIFGAAKNHRLRKEAHQHLKDALSWWAGYQFSLNRSQSETYRRFYYRFGLDMLSAQALSRPEAESLTAKINEDILRLHYEKYKH